MLKNQSCIEQFIPLFDFFDLDEILEFQVNFDYHLDPPQMNVFLEVGVPTDQGKFFLTIGLFGVTQLKLPELGGRWFGFVELEVQSVESFGLEGIKYYLVEPDEGFSCYCQDISFLRVQKLSENGERLEKWRAK
ncbi:hypothetical protein [Sulfidibacter corallicola]|uniref:Uncharacterized protein n=1 Tax=Sulfidibacter corallicola TaxID=2818388 RepID=A0A8A4TMQ6_SULCO|nr:hypothetical protein [Sulfidibacter corallicola]QTD50171.1 hypothetical protein J3U87_31690 [Sulfidibacter corallicola]